jgi:hypothetical protein
MAMLLLGVSTQWIILAGLVGKQPKFSNCDILFEVITQISMKQYFSMDIARRLANEYNLGHDRGSAHQTIQREPGADKDTLDQDID